LRRWIPRPASPELRERIFGAAAQPAGRPFHLADFSQWLVPVFGCFLLMIATLSERYPGHQSLPASLTNLLVSENTAMLVARQDHSDKNALPTPSLEWRFGGHSIAEGTSTGAFEGLPVFYTNKIIQ